MGTVLATAFVLTTPGASNPLIDLRLLGRRVFAGATITLALTGANMFGGLLLLPLYLQLAAGCDGTQTGLMLLAMGLGSAVALPISGTLTDRYGARPVVVTGASLLVITTAPFLSLIRCQRQLSR